jgi:hypothetical protein
MGKQKNHGGYSLREWSGLFANPLTSKLAVVFSKTRHPGKPGVPRAFSGCQFLAILDLARGAKKQGHPRSE